MDQNRRIMFDRMFEAFSIVAEGNYVYLCDIKNDLSRWSRTAVDYFGLPDEYMYGAGKIWEEHIHPDDRENYKISIENIFSGANDGSTAQKQGTENTVFVPAAALL